MLEESGVCADYNPDSVVETVSRMEEEQQHQETNEQNNKVVPNDASDDIENLENHCLMRVEVKLEKIDFPENLCKYCLKEFKSKNNLLKHIQNIHTQEYKYQCSKCPTRFKDYSSLKRHEQNLKIHSKSEVDESICQDCNKKFKSKFSRIRHQKVCKSKNNT